jgi:hypothetical protein
MCGVSGDCEVSRRSRYLAGKSGVAVAQGVDFMRRESDVDVRIAKIDVRVVINRVREIPDHVDETDATGESSSDK